IDPHRLGHVLQALGSEVFERLVDLILDLVIGAARNQDATWFGNPFQAGRDVDAVAVEIAAFDHDVAQVDSNTQHYPSILRPPRIGGFHPLLQDARAFDRIYGAGKFDQCAVAHELDDPPVMLVYQRLEDFRSARPEYGQRSRLVRLHEPAVTNHIRGQN